MSFCRKCGTELLDDDVFCGKCGAPVVVQEFQAPQSVPSSEQRTAPVKKGNPGRKIGIIVACIVLFLAMSYVVIWHLLPYIRYSWAEQEVFKCNFDVAYDTFIDLGDYKDSDEKADDTIYRKGQFLINREEFLEAAEEFERIPYYLDSKDKAVECRKQVSYLEGIEKYNSRQFEEAIKIFNNLGDYSDSKEWVNLSKYSYATEYYRNEEYTKAVDIFEALGNFKDSKDKANEARYEYVKAHKNNNDQTTFSYLIKLKQVNYSDSVKIYDTLYSWKITYVVNNSKTDSKTNCTSLSKYDTIYVHIKVSGGEPNEEIELRYWYEWPDGDYDDDEWEFDFYDGKEAWFCTWDYYPEYVQTGMFEFEIYSNEADVSVTGSIYITN